MNKKFSLALMIVIAMAITVLVLTRHPITKGPDVDAVAANSSPVVDQQPSNNAVTTSIEKINSQSGTQFLAANASHQINGILIDTAGNMIANGDILYTLVTAQMPCKTIDVDELAISTDTQIINSDDQGRFALPINAKIVNNPLACLLLHASAPGFHTTKLVVDNEALFATVEIELQAYHQLVGRVVTPTAYPQAEAVVSLWIQHENNRADNKQNKSGGVCDITTNQAVVQSKSNKNGEFSLEATSGEAYCLQAYHPDWASSVIHPVQLTDALASVTLSLQQAQQFIGTVRDLDNLPIGSLSLQLVAINSLATTEPIAEAKSFNAQSNGAGEFHFTGLDYGEYQLKVVTNNYAIAAPETIAIQGSSAIQHLDVTVFPLSLLTGTVLDSANKGISNVQVNVYSPYLPDLSLARSVTNKRGEFIIKSLHQSKAVRDSLAMINEFQTSENQQVVITRPEKLCINFYHPNFADQTITMSRSDAQIDLNPTVLLPSSVVMRGEVRAPDDQGLAAVLTLQPIPQPTMGHSDPPRECNQSFPPITITTDINGRFDFHPPLMGLYEITIETNRYSTRQQQITVDGSKSTLDLKLR